MKDLIEDTIKAMEELEEMNKNSIQAEKKSETSNDSSEKKVNNGDKKRKIQKIFNILEHSKTMKEIAMQHWQK